MIKLHHFAFIALLPSACVQADEPENSLNPSPWNRLSISTGFGIPYAMVGVNVNYRVIDEVEVFVGKGTWDESWGVRVFPFNEHPKFSLSLSYGVNTIMGSCQNESCDILQDGYAGYNAAIGFKPEVGQDGWGFDLVFALTQDNYKDDIDEAREAGFDVEEEGNGFEIAFGYRWSF